MLKESHKPFGLLQTKVHLKLGGSKTANQMRFPILVRQQRHVFKLESENRT